jgi:hypothetical protein
MDSTLKLRCYVAKKNKYYYACCIGLNLVDRSDTLDEAMESLLENILGYIECIVKEEMPFQLLQRKAPLSYILEYYWIKLLTGLKKKSDIFTYCEIVDMPSCAITKCVRKFIRL